MLDALCPLTEKGHEMVVAGRGDPDYEAFLRERYTARGARFLGSVNATDFLSQVDCWWCRRYGTKPCPLVVLRSDRLRRAGRGGPRRRHSGDRGRRSPWIDFRLRRCAAAARVCRSDWPATARLRRGCRKPAASMPPALSFDLTARRYLDLYQQTVN